MLTSRGWFVLVLPLWAACGIELLVADDGQEGPGAPDASASSSSSSSSSSSGSSSSSAGSSGAALDASADASELPDATGDADAQSPLVCTPLQLTDAFCSAGTAATCVNAGTSASPSIPDGAESVGSAYLVAPVDTAPFTISTQIRFVRDSGDNRYGVAAVFFGGDPNSTKSLCERIDLLAAGEAAVLYWRSNTGEVTSARIVVAGEGCGDRAFETPYRGDDKERELTIAYSDDGLSVSGAGLAAAVTKAVVLANQLRIGVLGQRYAGDGPPLQFKGLALTCP